MAIVKLQCSECRKVYQIPEERMPKDKDIAFPCPACRAIIRVERPGASSANSSPAGPGSEGEALKGDALKARILKRVTDLPPMPQTVFKAREILKDPRSSFQELAKILESDQGIAARVLKMANSAYYGMMGKVSSLQHASVLLGYKTLAEIVSLAGASTVLGSVLEGYGLSAGDLWKHSLGVAFGSRIIAAKKKPDLANDAFAAGLIHDAGKLVLDPYIFERKEAFNLYMEGEAKPFLVAEKQILGFDHAEIAFELCKVWNVPQPLIRAIRYHHSPANGQGDDLAHIVHMADAVSMMSGIGAGLDGLQYEMDDRTMQMLGMQEEDIPAIMVEIVESVQRIAGESQK
ncbi:MAG: HDOD domain-containing protein [Desulfobacteraceae bacterium]|nr:MAG: HDOD domain-containing protein [Desulfobacteraceae bacterium]